jgi:hypothetical protein
MILNFSIPKELYSQIDDYDVKKPKVAPETPTSRRSRTVSDFPKAGIPEQLVPQNIIPKNQLLEIIQRLNIPQNNTNYYDSRCVSVQHNENYISMTKVANKYWFALWFNSTDKETIFGYSICLRNLKTFKNYVRGRFWSDCGLNEDAFSVVKQHKKEYLYFKGTVTKDDLANHAFDSNRIRIDVREENFYSAIKEKLKKYILVWDNYTIFEAYNTSLANVAGNYDKTKDFSWVPDFSFIISKLGYQIDSEFAKKLETPFFKKKLNCICQNFIEAYNSPNFDRWDTKFNYNFIRVLDYVDKVYNYEISVDYLQQLWQDLKFDTESEHYRYFSSRHVSEKAKEWIKENVPVKSFINMFSKNHLNVADTVGMISDILQKKSEIKYEGRWRPQEFHDWAMGESWKLCNKNERLPQDLFPNPIHVDKMTFLQPRDVHQLANYGRAARNCVGSSSYSNGILKKNHFIVLALKEREPYLTIQCRLENEQLNVIQIKKNCNANLLSQEEAEYHDAFKKALMIRSQELAEIHD